MVQRNHILERSEIKSDRSFNPASGFRPVLRERSSYSLNRNEGFTLGKSDYTGAVSGDYTRIHAIPSVTLDSTLIVAPVSDNDLEQIEGKNFLCLLIAAHNEEKVIEKTLRSAINAGMTAKDIFVVDDNSTDNTSIIAKSVLPESNVIKVGRSGKGLALTKGAERFNLTEKYRWIHIADADGAFAPNYFEVFKDKLNEEYAAATGYIRSLPGKRISEYRVYEYTVGMEIHRRIQAMLGVISVVPGPTSCFRSDVFDQLDYASKSLTEDFDVTLQLYRKNLGKIQFIPEAVAYTQDPLTLKDFTKQITRWNRGVMQGVSRHKIGKKLTAIDAYLTYQLGQGITLFLSTFIWVPFMALTSGQSGLAFLSTTFVLDVLLTYLIVFFTAIKSKRWDVLGAYPIIYGLKWVSLLVFIKSFIEVIILKKFRISDGIWANDGGRRYQLNQSA